MLIQFLDQSFYLNSKNITMKARLNRFYYVLYVVLYVHMNKMVRDVER